MKCMLALALVLGCGGGSGGDRDTGAVTPTTAEGPCSAGCAYNVSCEAADLAECTQRCIEEVTPWVRLDALETIATCMADLTCAEDEDDCLFGVEPLVIHRDWEARCVAELVPCGTVTAQMCSVEPVAGDGNAGQVRFIAPAIVEEMLGCLVGECANRMSCVQSVLTSYNVNLL